MKKTTKAPAVFPGRKNTKKKIRLAAIGSWGKGFSDWLPMVKSGLAEMVAFCDTDPAVLPKIAEALKKDKSVRLNVAKVPFYTDFRKMLADQKKLGIEAVVIATADHVHACAAVAAMKLGLHVFVEKPLVRTLWEAKKFYETAKKTGVVTQMGNQGSGDAGFRRNVEVVRSGILGKVKSVHVWTNRPVWPQGKAVEKAVKCGWGQKELNGFNWDAWLGPAKMRPFLGEYLPGKKGYDPWNLSVGVYQPFSWRSFFDFGAGAFGDMACHTMNLPYRGLELGTVTQAKCVKIVDKTKTVFPMKSIVELTYAARKSKAPGREGEMLPEVKLVWYDGDNKPAARTMPQITAMKQFKGKVPDTGCLIVGSKGILCSCADYGQQAFIALKGEKIAVDVNDHPACKKIPETLPKAKSGDAGMDRSAGAASLSADPHYVEFLTAINGTGPIYADTNSRCFSDVEFSVPMMEGILVGVVAQQVPGLLKWDSKKFKFNKAAANKLVKPVFRKGWSL